MSLNMSTVYKRGAENSRTMEPQYICVCTRTRFFLIFRSHVWFVLETGVRPLRGEGDGAHAKAPPGTGAREGNRRLRGDGHAGSARHRAGTAPTRYARLYLWCVAVPVAVGLFLNQILVFRFETLRMRGASGRVRWVHCLLARFDSIPRWLTVPHRVLFVGLLVFFFFFRRVFIFVSRRFVTPRKSVVRAVPLRFIRVSLPRLCESATSFPFSAEVFRIASHAEHLRYSRVCLPP